MLRQELSIGASVGVSWGAGSFKASFSANSAYQKDTQELRESTNSYIDVTGRAVAYRARLSTTDRQSKVSLAFERSVHRIPSYTCDSDDVTLIQPYLDLLHEFGTHFTREVVMGARAVQRTVVSRQSAAKMDREMRERGFGGGVSGGYGPVAASVSASTQNKQSTESSSKRGTETSETREFYVGGSAPSGKLENGSTESLREWARSARENPAPIQYSLVSIDDLLKTDAYFRNPVKYLSAKRRCLQLAVRRFCLSATFESELCTTEQSLDRSQHTRRKRSIDNDNAQYIRYGDFIQLTGSSGSMLELSKEISFVGGEGPCYKLTTRSGEKKHRKYFQILPEAGDVHLMGDLLTFGSRFRLNSQQGVDIMLVPNLQFNLGVMVNQNPDDFDRIKQHGWSLCVPGKPMTGKTSYILKSKTGFWYRIGDSVTMLGSDGSSAWAELPGHEMCRKGWCDLSEQAILLPDTTKDVGTLSKILLHGKHSSQGPLLELNVVHVKKKRLYKFECRYKENKQARDCTTNNTERASGLETLLEKHTSYPVGFSFRSIDAHGTLQPVSAHAQGVMQVHSNRPQEVAFWGHEAPEVLAGEKGQVTVDTVHIMPDITECMKKISEKILMDSHNSTTIEKYAFKTGERVVRIIIDLPHQYSTPYPKITCVDSNGNEEQIKPVRLGNQLVARINSLITIRNLTVEYQPADGSSEQTWRTELTICTEAHKALSRSYNSHMEWTMTGANIKLITRPIIDVIEKTPIHDMKPTKLEVQSVEISVVYSEKNVICSDDDIEFRKALGSLLDDPDVSFDEVSTNLSRTDQQAVLSLRLKLEAVSSNIIDSLVRDLKDRLALNPYELPCQKPAPSYSKQNEDYYPRSRPCLSKTFIVLLCACVVIALCILGLIGYHCQYKKGNKFQEYSVGPDRCASYECDNMNAHDYVNAYVNLHRMMSSVSHPGHYSDIPSQHPRCRSRHPSDREFDAHYDNCRFQTRVQTPVSEQFGSPVDTLHPNGFRVRTPETDTDSRVRWSSRSENIKGNEDMRPSLLRTRSWFGSKREAERAPSVNWNNLEDNHRRECHRSSSTEAKQSNKSREEAAMRASLRSAVAPDLVRRDNLHFPGTEERAAQRESRESRGHFRGEQASRASSLMRALQETEMNPLANPTEALFAGEGRQQVTQEGVAGSSNCVMDSLMKELDGRLGNINQPGIHDSPVPPVRSPMFGQHILRRRSPPPTPTDEG